MKPPKFYFLEINGKVIISNISESAFVELTANVHHENVDVQLRPGCDANATLKTGGTFCLKLDQTVLRQFDSVEDQNGESRHNVVRNADGDIIFDEVTGDWTNTLPNAYKQPAFFMGKKSLRFLI